MEVYMAGAAVTAVYLFRINRPTEAGGWIAWAGFVIAWPALFLFALAAALRGKR